ncbi:MAG: hypothetical protein QN188_04135 [Armatimonadota bacterium]|nr:hypothetical protein [Armatimonadota bacterium]MDR5675529.1 hypothetical protein [Armatimonadota bacterium]MDR5688831.1 hypothetical protein [Armatimonadota bacterium]MDR7388912.1 hypothetical protein [Armatimonadota bacterium]MDR7392337.1 hypothetical protein [Armatimonadota bacterium]
MRPARWLVWGAAAVLLAAWPWSAWAQAVEVEDALRATYEAASDTWWLEGDPVRIRRGDLVVEARTVRYRARQGEFEATGGVRVQRGAELEVRADRAEGSVREGRAVLDGGVHAAYLTGQGTVRLAAPRAHVDFGRRTARASGGARVSWADAGLEAQEVLVDGGAEVAVASGDPVVRWREVRLVAGAMRADLRAQVLKAEGGVRLEDPEGVARGHEAEVLWRERVAILRGQVVARRGTDELRADEVRYAWERGVLAATGRSRVVVHP